MSELIAIAAAEEAQGRRRQMLRTAFGPTIATALTDPTVIEVMVNPDGRLWIERAAIGRVDSGERIGHAEAERIIRLVAAHVRREVTDKTPIVSAELPETGERFEGLIPPVVASPTFAIRKPAVAIFTLRDYAATGIMSAAQADLLRRAVEQRLNLLVRPHADPQPVTPAGIVHVADEHVGCLELLVKRPGSPPRMRAPHKISLRWRDLEA